MPSQALVSQFRLPSAPSIPAQPLFEGRYSEAICEWVPVAASKAAMPAGSAAPSYDPSRRVAGVVVGVVGMVVGVGDLGAAHGRCPARCCRARVPIGRENHYPDGDSSGCN